MRVSLAIFVVFALATREIIPKKNQRHIGPLMPSAVVWYTFLRWAQTRTRTGAAGASVNSTISMTRMQLLICHGISSHISGVVVQRMADM